MVSACTRFPQSYGRPFDLDATATRPPFRQRRPDFLGTCRLGDHAKNGPLDRHRRDGLSTNDLSATACPGVLGYGTACLPMATGLNAVILNGVLVGLAKLIEHVAEIRHQIRADTRPEHAASD